MSLSHLYQHKYQTNYQDILKFIALLAMIIDHVGLYLLPEERVLRYIGRYAFPIFAFFAGYNFRGKVNYRLLIYGIFLQAVTNLYFFQNYKPLNILLGIFLGQLYLTIEYKIKNINQLIILALLMPLTEIIIEYGTLVIMIMLIGRKIAELKVKNWQFYSYILIIIVMSYLHSLMNFYHIDNIYDFLGSLLISILLFISLTGQNFEHSYPIKLIFLRNNLIHIYYSHLLIILFFCEYLKK